MGQNVVWGQIHLSDETNVIELSDNQNVHALLLHKNIPFKNIQTLPFHNFDDSSFYYLKKNETLWLKFKVVNTTARQAQYFLFASVEFVDLYQQADTGWIHKKNGYFLPLSQQYLKDVADFLPINLSAHESTTVYVKLKSGNFLSARGKLGIYNKVSFFKQKWLRGIVKDRGLLFNIIYLSALSTITLFILSIFLFVKNKIYIYYILYLIFQIVYGFIINARIPSDIYNPLKEFPMLGYITNEGVQFIFLGFYALFLLRLLEIKKYSKLLYRCTLYLGYFCFIYAGISIINYTFLANSSFVWQSFISIRYVLLPIYAILTIWTIVKVKHPLLVYFILGNVFFAAGSFFSVYLSTSYIDPDGFFFFPQGQNAVFQLGLLGEVISFSFAIAYQIRNVQRKKEQADKSYILQLKKTKALQENMNKTLNLKVEEKTVEIKQLYRKIELQREQEIKDKLYKKINESKLLALRTQMNPHFIFNSLNSIKYLILEDDVSKASEYLDQFAALLRNILQNAKKEFVTIEDELEILRLYLSLEKERLSDKFEYRISIHCDKEELYMNTIPALLLQTFAENAIWHGLMPSEKEEKILNIEVSNNTNNLTITIEDNGIGFSNNISKGQKGKGKSYGLAISKERIDLYNQTNDTSINLNILEKKEKGKVFGVKISITYTNEGK